MHAPKIDISFNVLSDTPVGKDPDSHSATLRRYHALLWSKPLPGGGVFQLTEALPKAYLHHCSERGEFFLSSDSIGRTFQYVRSMSKIIEHLRLREVEDFSDICHTVGAFTLFPSRRIDGKTTINGARGLNAKIKDRTDLTLECIRRHYAGQPSPLSEALARYKEFFALFASFEGYVEFFLLQDMVAKDGATVDFALPFCGFEGSPLPRGIDEYRIYRDKTVAFIKSRNRRIAAAARLL